MKYVFLLFILTFRLNMYAQCEIHSEVQPNGTINKVTSPEIFYYTDENAVHCSAIYDGEDYYIELIVKPASKKEIKLNKVVVELGNGEKGEVTFYDRYVNKKDSSVNILFKISNSFLEVLTQQEVVSIVFPLEERDKNYRLIKHRDLLKKQLTCLIKDVKKEKEE